LFVSIGFGTGFDAEKVLSIANISPAKYKLKIKAQFRGVGQRQHTHNNRSEPTTREESTLVTLKARDVADQLGACVDHFPL